MSDDEWYDTTLFGSAYETQVSRTGKKRWRPISGPIDLPILKGLDVVRTELPWQTGEPPRAE